MPAADPATQWPDLAARVRARRQFYLFWGTVALLLVLLSPFGAYFAAGLPACPFKTLTGWPCPACGATRAALALAQFELFFAFRHYPLATLGWIGLIGGGLAAGTATLLGYALPEEPRRWPGWARYGLVAAVLGNWVYSIVTGV